MSEFSPCCREITPHKCPNTHPQIGHRSPNLVRILKLITGQSINIERIVLHNSLKAMHHRIPFDECDEKRARKWLIGNQNTTKKHIQRFLVTTMYFDKNVKFNHSPLYSILVFRGFGSTGFLSDSG